MKLYTLLRDRASINVLKILYDNEAVGGKYSMSYTDLRRKSGIVEGGQTIENLELAGLISQERNGGGETVLSITQKGKDFIAAFDRLIESFEGKKEAPKAYQVKYELTQLEERMLLLCSKLKSETGSVVGLQALANEVYPYKEPSRSSGTISKNAKRLEELNLIVRVKKNNRTFFDITESGERLVKEQLLEAAAPEM